MISHEKHDIYKEDRVAFIGDDTGLIKQVKVNVRRRAIVDQVKYDDPDSDEDQPWRYKGSMAGLTSVDNQKTVSFKNEVTCKLGTKSGKQVKDEGIICMHKVHQSDNLLAYVRGKSNVVQTFDPSLGEAVGSIDYTPVLNTPIQGFHAVQAS